MKIIIKITFFTFYIISFKNSNAQKSYSIWYKYYSTDTSLHAFGNGPNVHYQYDSVQVRSIISDSLIYSYFVYDKKDKFKNKLEFGKKIVYPSLYYSKNKDEVYKFEGHLPRKKVLLNMYRIRRTWTPYFQKKIILGYECESVFMASNKNDSTIVYFTKQLNINAAPFNGYFDIPGVVLQIIDNRYNRMVFADKIDDKDYKIILPDLEIITEEQLEDYFKILHKKNN